MLRAVLKELDDPLLLVARARGSWEVPRIGDIGPLQSLRLADALLVAIVVGGFAGRWEVARPGSLDWGLPCRTMKGRQSAFISVRREPYGLLY